MEIDFRARIAVWREKAELTQEELDEACGFSPGTISRLEQKRAKLTEKQFIQILSATGRDLLWSLAEAFGTAYRHLEPLEREKRASRGKPTAEDLPVDADLQKGLQEMLSGAQVVVMKMVRATDERRWFADLLLRAAGTDEAQRKRKRVRKARPPAE